MKRITAIIITAAAFVGCSYVGSASAHAKNCPALANSVSTVFGSPDYALDYLIKICDLGAKSKRDGLSKEAAFRIANKPAAPEIEKEVAKAMSMAFLAGYEAGN